MKALKSCMTAALVAGCLYLPGVTDANASGAPFNLKGSGNSDCLGVQFTLNGQSQTVKRGDTVPCVGAAVADGTNVAVKLVFMGGYLNCAGAISEQCRGTLNLVRSAVSGQICQKPGDNGATTLKYTITRNAGSCGVQGSWDITFTADYPPIPLGGR